MTRINYIPHQSLQIQKINPTASSARPKIVAEQCAQEQS